MATNSKSKTLSGKALYIYPYSKKIFQSIQNPYIQDLINSLSEYASVVNQSKPTSLGIFDIYRRFFKLDIVIFNWVEDLPDKRFGKIQSYLLVLLYKLIRISRKKIIWILHDKVAHSNSNLEWKKRNQRSIIKHCDLILTHSREGVEYLKTVAPKALYKAFFYHHPVKQTNIYSSTRIPKKYDVLIWGSVSRYKGIDVFIKALREHDLLDKFSILIAGKFLSDSYFNEVKHLAGRKITIKNEFIEQAYLREMMLSSKIVLFTYLPDSVLSSGALMDSLLYDTRIIGPKFGAFADLGNENLIDCYNSIDELPNIINTLLSSDNIGAQLQNREQFLKENTWKRFANNVFLKINQKLIKNEKVCSNNVCSQ